MDFAFDPLDARQDARRVWNALAGAPASASRWLLVDAALLDAGRLAAAVRRAGWTTHNTLAGSALEAFGTAAPTLIALPADADADAAVAGIERVLAVAPAAPACSWFASASTPHELCRLFAALAQPQVELEMKVCCRFADARVLPVLWDVLDDMQQARVALHVGGWGCFGRQGELLRHRWAPAGPVARPAEGPLVLGDAQFNRMLDASEADGIFSLLLEKTPEVVPDTGRGAFHQKLLRCLAEASRLQVEQPADRVQFVMLSLTCSEHFHRHGRLQDTWAAIARKTARLTESMQHWDDVLWAELPSC